MKNIRTTRSLDYKNYYTYKNAYIRKHDVEKEMKDRIIQLENELEYTKACLQISNEEHLIYNEELLSANEEIQSMNEELLKINTQYHNKNQQLEELYNDITNYLDNSDIGMIFLDENLCIRKFTPSITKEIHLKSQDIGRPIDHIVNNLIHDDFNRQAKKVLKSGIAVEKEVQSKKGNWYLLKCAPYCIFKNVIKGVTLSLVNITKRKHAEMETVKSKERYEQLVENSPYSIYIIQDGKFYFSNSAGLKLLNIKDLKELVHIHYEDYFNIDEEALIDKIGNSIESQGQHITPKEDTLIQSDGNERLVEISAMSVIFDGNVAKLLLVNDTTFRIKQRFLEEENKKHIRLLDEAILSETLKTEFFSNLSHELRTPLNIILCTLQLLDDFASDDHVSDQKTWFKKYTNIIKQNSYRQLRLVNNMIDITKLDAGFFKLNLQNCNIVSLVENVTLSVAEYIGAQSIAVLFDTDIETCIVSCDPEKIERVILNLLSNAIKFTPPGGNMTVTMHDKGENIILSIKDTGIGIPDDKLAIIFDRFRQVDKSLTRRQEGSGIGLSIVKSLVEMHQGKIDVVSEYGKGTEFIIELPVRVVPEQIEIPDTFRTESQTRIERIHIEFSDIYSLN